MLVLILALLACGQAPDPVALWSTDPEAALAAIRAMDDPAERALTLNAILSANPGNSAQLCPELEPGPARERCERFNQRPHLWTVSPGAPATPPARAAPPQDVRIPAALLLLSPADPGPCTATDAACISGRAHAAARQGDAEAAARACAALADARSRQDCAFSAAERVPPGPAQYPLGMRLCFEAGSYAEMCHGHVLLAMLSTPAGEALANRVAQSEQIQSFWADKSPETARLAVDRFWSLALAAPGTRADAIDASTLPPAALPQLHNLAAEARLGLPRQKEGGRWKDFYPGEEAIPWVFGLDMGTGVRPTAADPALDALLARLELEPLRGEAGVAALAEALAHPDPLVRWSAARLLSQHTPDHPALIAARQDPDPLVRARAAELPPPALGQPQ